MKLLLAICFVLELGSKAWPKRRWCNPSTLGSAGGLVVSDGDDPATSMVPCDALGPADAPVIQDEVDTVIPDAVAPMCDGDPDDFASKIPCEHGFKMQALVISDQGIPGDADQ